ncbi:Ldh family oxidoreductase [Saccharomonospora sp. NPDC046836]|uniref:Ldh family oxidoreductase n=1 Tax=Saccharomonospora sp. NPDC046836 TaxID=3156921 RepID=UPI0033E1AAB9
MQRFSAYDLHEQVHAILTAWGMPSGPATTTADVMIDTDLSGIDSHGVSMLMMYERLHTEGRLGLAATPRVLRETDAFAAIDAGSGLGHPAAVHAMELAIAKARNGGIGAAFVGSSNHYGAVGYYVRLAAEQGMIGFATTSTRTPTAQATGGNRPVLGTNPLAFAAPRRHGAPLVVDMSTTVVAMNKVKAYALKGLDLPVGWLVDEAGVDVTNATKGYALLQEGRAMLAPLGGPGTELGGHKGFGLALMVQILSAALSNGALPRERGDTDNLGHFFLAIDAERVNPGGLTAGNVEAILRVVQEDQPDVLVPGQPEEHARAERTRAGIPLTDSLLEHLAAISARAGVHRTLTPLAEGTS